MKLLNDFSLPKDGKYTASWYAIFRASRIGKNVGHLVSGTTQGIMIYLLITQFSGAYLPTFLLPYLTYFAIIIAVMGSISLELGTGGIFPSIVDNLFNGGFRKDPIMGTLAILVFAPFLLGSFYLSIKGGEKLGSTIVETDKPIIKSKAELEAENSLTIDRSLAAYQTEIERLNASHTANIQAIKDSYSAKKAQAQAKAADYDKLYQKGHTWAQSSAKAQRAKILSLTTQESEAILKANEAHQAATNNLANRHQNEQTKLKEDLEMYVLNELDEQGDVLKEFKEKQASTGNLFGIIAQLSVFVVLFCSVLNSRFRQKAGVRRGVIALRFPIYYEYYLATMNWIKKRLRLSVIPDRYEADRVKASDLTGIAQAEYNNSVFTEKWGTLAPNTLQPIIQNSSVQKADTLPTQNRQQIGFKTPQSIVYTNSTTATKQGNQYAIIHKGKPYTMPQIDSYINTYTKRSKESKQATTRAKNAKLVKYWVGRKKELQTVINQNSKS